MRAEASKSRQWIGPLIVLITASIMLNWSWGTWLDCVRDFGRELYVPWRLSEGELLYRDIVSYFNGPLSPYLHAMLFKIFGVSLRTLVVFNLFVIAALAMMMYALMSRAFGSLAATVAGVTFFILFAFAQLTPAGNYNFLCPYSYELPHGISLSVAAILCLDNWRRSARRAWLIAAGALLGFVFLTKAEVFAAAAFAVFSGLILIVRIKQRTKRAIAVFCGSAIAPVITALTLLRVAGLPFATALRGIAGAWRWLGDSTLLDMPYFKQLAGTDNVGASARIILIWSLAYAILLGTPILLAFALRKFDRRASTIAAATLFIALTFIGLWRWLDVNWNNMLRPAPVVLLVAALCIGWKILRMQDESRWLVWVLVAWSLGMLAKIALNAHIYHYGFALAMPATMVMIGLLIDVLPRAVERSGASGNFLRATVLAAIVVMIHPQLRFMDRQWSSKTVLVGDGADAFRAGREATIINRAITAISATNPHDTLVVVPEGLLINYLTRRVNPTGQLNFTPPAIVMYGEKEMQSEFAAHPPASILIITIDESEYGPRLFGIDYGKELGGWIEHNYRPVEVFAREDFSGQRTPAGAILLRKSPP